MTSDGKDRGPSRGEISQEDREAFRKRAAEIGRRLDDVKERRPQLGNTAQRGAALSQAFKIAAELIAGLVVGGGIGWALDQAFGTRPWLLVVFLILGFAGGMRNVIRTAQRMQAEAEPLQRAGKSVGPDDD